VRYGSGSSMKGTLSTLTTVLASGHSVAKKVGRLRAGRGIFVES